MRSILADFERVTPGQAATVTAAPRDSEVDNDNVSFCLSDTRRTGCDNNDKNQFTPLHYAVLIGPSALKYKTPTCSLELKPNNCHLPSTDVFI